MSASFSHHAMSRAAIARRASVDWRIGYSTVCAFSAWLTTGQFWPTAVLCATMVGLMLLECRIADLYLEAGGKRRELLRGAFMASVLASITSYTMVAGWAGWHGGVPGLIAAVLMTSASIVNLILLMVEAPHALALSVAPGALLLATLPFLSFLPWPAPSADPVWAAFGLSVMIASYGMQGMRTAKNHALVFGNLTQAKVEAEMRRSEAEAGRAEAEQSRREAVRANQLKTEFLCTVTHELRTPLNAVINYSEMIVEETDGVIAQDAHRIVTAARHLLSLIERIIDFADLDAGSLNLKPVMFDADVEVRLIVDAYRRHIEANGNVVGVETVPTRVLADREHFRKCLECLLSNAAKWCTNGRVLVTLGWRDDQMRVSVRDTGPGMSAQALEGAFEAFSQVIAREHGAEGLGLGLAAARRTARLMGGDLTVQSELGLGTLFELSLPAAPSTISAKAAA